ncbi:hypothetical protein ABR738_00865 [Streptomyces sp. Edi4]|uniref:hypothetical protein n=1 Tax=Streptomyces sp. Edi4 TaxID=3162527 RepID=UPI003305AB46
MPNQLAAVRVLTEGVVGPQVWDGRTGECQTMPTNLYYQLEDAMAAVLERITAAVNWPRLLLEASWRHATLHEKTAEDEQRPAGEGTPWECSVRGVCGECLRHALLSPETGAHPWEDRPDVPLTRTDLDWAPVTAAALGHRRTATPSRGRESSAALTEARTVLSRAESALRNGPTEHLYTDDGRGLLHDEHGEWATAYDPDHEQIQQALASVVALLAPWRSTGRPPGTAEQRRATQKGVRCDCGRLWADRVGPGHAPATIWSPSTPNAEPAALSSTGD